MEKTTATQKTETKKPMSDFRIAVNSSLGFLAGVLLFYIVWVSFSGHTNILVNVVTGVVVAVMVSAVCGVVIWLFSYGDEEDNRS